MYTKVYQHIKAAAEYQSFISLNGALPPRCAFVCFSSIYALDCHSVTFDDDDDDDERTRN